MIRHTYDTAVTKSSATAPIPPYTSSPKKPSAPTPTTPKDTLYWLLNFYATTSPQISQISDDAEMDEGVGSGSVTSFAVTTPTSVLPTNLLLSVINPANITRDPMDFSLAWHLYTVLRGLPALSSVIDLPVPHRLHTSYLPLLQRRKNTKRKSRS